MGNSGTAALSEIVSSLITDPLLGFNQAQIDIVNHWVAVLERLKAQSNPAATPQDYAAAIAMAPKWSAHVRGDVSTVMRIANLKRRDGGLKLGLAVGPFQAAGSFGFMSETATESVIQARASYVVSNDAGETSLRELLETLGLPGAISPDNVDDAIQKLGTLKSTLPPGSAL